MAAEPSFWSIAVPAASGLIGAVGGAFWGAWLSRWNEQRKQRLEFCAQQLRDLYSPLLATRTHLRALGKLRLRIEETHMAFRGNLVRPTTREEAMEEQSRRSSHTAEARKLIEYNNEQFKTVLLPQYQRMLGLLQDKYWLADESTREHYQALLQYVEVWRRFTEKSIPDDVILTFDVREKELYPLYENLKDQFERLQLALKLADPDAIVANAAKAKVSDPDVEEAGGH